MSFENVTPTGDNDATTSSAGFSDQEGSVSTEGNVDLMKLLQKRVDDGQVFVTQLKDENADMRKELVDIKEQLEGAQNLRDLLNSDQGEATTYEPLDTQKVTQAVLTEIKRKENMVKVETAMEKLYGADYGQVVLKKAQEMGINATALDKMCYDTPAAALKLFSGDKPNTVLPTQSNASAHSLAPSEGSNGYDKEYFSNLRRTDKRAYWKPEVQKAYRNMILQEKGIS